MRMLTDSEDTAPGGSGQRRVGGTGKVLSTCMLVPGRLTVRRLLEAPPIRLKDTPHRCSEPTQRALAAPIAARASWAEALWASGPATAQAATAAPVAARARDFMCPPRSPGTELSCGPAY